MKDNGSIISSNTTQSIRTNYNNYKRKIKRVNSKPSISRTKEFFNNEIYKNNTNNTSYNNINNYSKNQNYIQNDLNTNYRNNTLNYYPSEANEFTEQRNYEIYKKSLYPNTKRVLDTNYQEAPKMLKHINNDNTPKDDWAEMLCHPSTNPMHSKRRISNSKTFQSNVFPSDNDPVDPIRHNKPAKYSDMLHKTQITTLPGCVKRGKYDIKDDKKFNMKNTESYLYKMERDFSSNVCFGPLTKEEEEAVNNFPIEQRYQGSYQRGVKDNDIFNLKMNKENDNPYGDHRYGYNNDENNNYKGKKMFKNNNTFKSQIEFA